MKADKEERGYGSETDSLNVEKGRKQREYNKKASDREAGKRKILHVLICGRLPMNR